MKPYRITSEFNAITLPAGLRQRHATKAGVWAVIRILEGTATLVYVDTGEVRHLTSCEPGLIKPEQTHYLKLSGLVRLKLEFYDSDPVHSL
ncbi:DUF1971 domain-containing protein [Acetobacter sp.]|jgi:tellurite resistance-related uncharacterized protein|uniref:DUF1971 domain-containing protein n=1 Tax=Acetobacter sp. TaxID=440 RepID=UPI0025BCB6BD|nr:DUF1971 domain-containing protein [Acetobacter sp.]MCH4091184.1 DUF1971 domain-containing protein [Acetobacter sp.]